MSKNKVTYRCKSCGTYYGTAVMFCLKCKEIRMEDVSCRHCFHFKKDCPNNIFGRGNPGNSCNYFEVENDY